VIAVRSTDGIIPQGAAGATRIFRRPAWPHGA
jgi:hypothetical protein